MRQRHLSRRIHRALVPLGGIPLLITALSGSLYGMLLAQNIDVGWLLRIHTGNFGIINLQPYYSAIIGLLTLMIAISGISLLRGNRPSTPSSTKAMAEASRP
jgi:hypothetical protein